VKDLKRSYRVPILVVESTRRDGAAAPRAAWRTFGIRSMLFCITRSAAAKISARQR
jgi:hypothetical protein